MIEWIDIVRNQNMGSRSIDLLDVEEQKHIELFRRYSEALEQINPEDARAVMELERLSRKEFLFGFLDPELYESPTHYHYTIWLGILYFEEHTIWVDEVFKGLGDKIQTTWKQAHYCHRREETQHVLTDECYLRALDTTRDERYYWSRSLFGKLFEEMAIEADSLIRMTESRFPGLELGLASAREEMSKRFVERFSHRLFKRTQACAPYVEALIGLDKGVEQSSRVAMDTTGLAAALKQCLADILNREAETISPNEEFFEMDLDSLGYLSLAADVSRLSGLVPESTIAFQYSTLNQLVEYIESASAQG